MTTQQASVAALKLSKAQYIELCDTLRERAQEAHFNARKWANRALEAESRLAIYEPGDPPSIDARAWMNRALLAESQLAALRAAYEPERPAT